MLNEFWNGNCHDLIKNVPDNSVDLILTDPPYVLKKENWDKIDVFNDYLISELNRILKPTGSLYVWCGIGERSQSLIRWYPKLEQSFHFKDLITWKKRRGIGMRKGWLYTREEIMWWVKDNKQFLWKKEEQYSNEVNQFKKGFKGTAVHPFKRITNVWTDIPETLGKKKNTSHATPKPHQSLERIIKAHTNEGDLVFDPFAGSGSTLISAKRLNRNYLGIELNQDIYKETKNNLK